VLLGTHAPLTGAAPVPSDSAQKGADLYYRWLAENGKKIHGRTVDVILKNDNYNPSQAVAVCKEMVEKDKVFALAGLAGTDQIQACARYAASVGVPYSSAGVTEIGLEGLPNYFAISMTYAEQGPLLADYVINKLGGKGESNGMLRFDTPNFQDAHDSFANAMASKGAKLAYDRAVSKGAGTTEAQSVVQEMKTAGIENVYVLTSPVWWLQVLQAAGTQDFRPQWVGVGISMTFDTVATVACKYTGAPIDKAKFFSPFQAWSDRNRYSPDFEKAVRAIYPEENNGTGDDFMYVGWGAGQLGAAFLEKAGPNLTRGSFAAAIASTKNLQTEVFPPVTFSSSDHFGGTAVHVNEARCSDGRWHTLQANATDF
jgi:ABC-type branched-subunit amino acid transport system substrate-binding protein